MGNNKSEKSDAILRARNLRVTRAGATILDIHELVINECEVLSLIGPNGAGKTTLLQNLCYLHKQFEGEIRFRNKIIGKDYGVSDYRQRVAMVFQEPLLFDTTVFKNVSSGLKRPDLSSTEVRRAVDASLIRVNKFAKALPSEKGRRSSRSRT